MKLKAWMKSNMLRRRLQLSSAILKSQVHICNNSASMHFVSCICEYGWRSIARKLGDNRRFNAVCGNNIDVVLILHYAEYRMEKGEGGVQRGKRKFIYVVIYSELGNINDTYSCNIFLCNFFLIRIHFVGCIIQLLWQLYTEMAEWSNIWECLSD